MRPNTFDLTQLKSEMGKYAVKKCRLHHEKIACDPDTGKPVYREIGNEKNFERIGFCAPAIRKNRLGCAHSMVNDRFCHILKSLQVYNPVFFSLWEKFDRSINKIYALDHQKSDLEKKLIENPAKETKQKIEDIECEHSELIGEIASVHREALQKIDNLLAKNNAR